MDRSAGVTRLIDELHRILPQTEAGCDAEANFLKAPMRYIYVCNKTSGPLNIPGETHRITALTECELTFCQNHDNTLRLRYFVQLTHGLLIHGISWVKASPEIPFCDADFRPVLEFVTDRLLAAESSAATPAFPQKYGIWDGRRHRVGCMHNFVVKGFEERSHIMSGAVANKMLYLLRRAYAMFTENEKTIINHIHTLVSTKKS